MADSVTEQHTQSAHKIIVKKLNGYTFKVDSVGFPTLDGVAMAIDEQNSTNTVYSGGNAVVIVYQSGKVAMMVDGKFIGYMK